VDRDRTNFAGYSAILRRRWRLVAFIVVVAVAASLAYSLSQAKTYTATSVLLIEPTGSASGSSSTAIDPEEVATQAQVVSSLPVAKQVIKRLNLSDSPQDLVDDVTVSVNGTRVLDVAANRDTAAGAADVANTFAKEYLTYRQQQVTSSRSSQLAHLTSLQAKVATIDQKIASNKGRSDDALTTRRQSLQTQIGQVSSELSALAKYSAASIAGGEVLRPATEPGSATSPKPLRNAVVVAVLALIVGLGIALLRDRMDEGIHDDSTLRETAPGHPFVGTVGHWSDAGSGGVASLASPRSAVSESYRSVATGLRLLLAGLPSSGDRRGQVMLVTSPSTVEGKSSTASNVAIAAARMGLRVVLVDADLRSPDQAATFGLPAVDGLADLLQSEASAKQYLVEVGVDGLALLPAGTPTSTPAELVGSPRMGLVLSDVAAEADLVIVDSPALLNVADAVSLLPLSDLVVLVTRKKVSQRDDVKAAVNKIEQVRGGATGLVLNDV
jgi:succinoglycan biosynthesis transport protein ExoP